MCLASVKEHADQTPEVCRQQCHGPQRQQRAAEPLRSARLRGSQCARPRVNGRGLSHWLQDGLNAPATALRKGANRVGHHATVSPSHTERHARWCCLAPPLSRYATRSNSGFQGQSTTGISDPTRRLKAEIENPFNASRRILVPQHDGRIRMGDSPPHQLFPDASRRRCRTRLTPNGGQAGSSVRRVYEAASAPASPLPRGWHTGCNSLNAPATPHGQGQS